MDEALLRKAKEVFLEAVERPADERDRFLDARCGADAALRRAVEELLEGDRDAMPGFLSGVGDGGCDSEHGEDDGMTGRRVGSFTVERLLASGGMGRVYVATQDRPRRSVALKLMRPGIASRSALRRFELESQVLGRLRHPNIAQVYEAGTHDDGSGGAPYFAMEYVLDARSITTHAEAAGLGVRERLQLFARVCDAVHHGHESGVIHRDLKPSNILVDAAGTPKIIDFGVAKATDSDLAVTTVRTDVAQLVGTLQYMSPEQCAGERGDLDARSDVYAMGIVLYELLCGALPYDVSGVSIPEAARVIQDETPTKPSTVNRTLRGDVETIALKALEKDRVRRYASAAALARDIDRFLRGEGIEARRPSALYRARTFTRRHRVASAVIALLLTLGPLLAVATMVAVRSSARARALGDRLVTMDPRAATPQATGRSWSGIERGVDEAVIAFMLERGVPGATVAISKDGRLVHAKGYGFADGGRQIEMQPWHRSRIDVVGNTLVITPALLMLLESLPDVDLDTPLYGPGGVFEDEPFLADIEIGIADLAPEERRRQRDWYRMMTLRHLVTGTSGFGRNVFRPEEFLELRYGALDAVVTLRDLHRQVLRAHRVRHEPGMVVTPRRAFVGHDRALVGLALTVLSGISYVTYVEENVLEPLGLRGVVVPEGTIVDQRDARPHTSADARARGHVVALEITKVSRPRPYSAYGGWVASARDLVRLMTAMDGFEPPRDILSATALDELRRLSAEQHTAPTTWLTRTNSRGHRKYARAAREEGGASCIVMFPDGYVSNSGMDLSRITIAVGVNILLGPNTLIERELADRLVLPVGEASIPASFDLWDDPALSPPTTP